MKVFELARELNIPGKDLIVRMKAIGHDVEKVFDELDDKLIDQIKAKVREPVAGAKEKDPTPAEPAEDAEAEEPEQPRKRRIISARKPKQEKKAEPVEDSPVEEVLVEPAAEETAAAAPEDGDKEQDAAETATVETAEQAAAAEAIPEEGAAQQETDKAAGAPAKEEKFEEDESESRPKARPQKQTAPRWRERVDEDSTEEEGTIPDVDPNQWKQAAQVVAKPVVPPTYNREWVRPTRSRKGSDRRPGRSIKKSSGRDQDKHTFDPRKRKIRIGQQIIVSSLAGALGVKANEIIKKLMALGIMATMNEPVDGATAELIAAEFNIEVEADTTSLEDMAKEEAVDASQLRPRPPIVTIMGHVDHGKTSLLDYIRSTSVTAKESGGITQHIGAYHVKIDSGETVFLDTPGHEAFTTLRARGANITDLVVLVVAADDGVMPQTVEAIEHARAAEVPILVAINKIDREQADPEKIKRQLMEHELLAEEFGGETVLLPVSAQTGEGIPQLLEMIHLQAEMMELRATYEGRARGFVIESRMDRRKGPVATVIVQRGTLKVGDFFLVGATYGRVRAMFDDQGKSMEEATPSIPVEVLGYNELPQAGDDFVVMEDEKTARQLASDRQTKKQEAAGSERRRMHLEDFMQGVEEKDMTSLNLIVKADTQGSLEALRHALDKQGADNAMVEIIRGGVGGVTETDISLASTTNSVVVGFNVRADSKAQDLALAEGIEIKIYTVIYDLINEVRDALQGLLKPIIREEIIGHGEVRDVFSATKEGQIAGSFIKDGRLERNSLVRLYRDDVLIHSGTIGSLRRFKDDVQQVAAGYECGLRISNCTDIRVGDLIEAYVTVEETQVLEESGRG